VIVRQPERKLTIRFASI